ncbi:MAG: ABC transporter ATP-binding protein [Gammaproteobacteria bacterium]|nr:MAG: ABC transporter ATP-binding protein [Gammaproteobacteria bacterium]RLA23048.1 MAG: ABC transporter ATP-binding protein [Gammaproteobacteria bacterium]
MIFPVEVSQISKAFQAGEVQVQALDQVSFKLMPGQVTGLIGPDGAGKTTLMRLLCGLLSIDEGEITVLGLDAAKQPESVQSRVSYMPQRFGLYEDLTAQENLDLYADLKGLAVEDRLERYKTLMHLTGLSPFTKRLAGKLSGGMKQKLGLACALVVPPELLLLDEPTVGVDPVSRRELWQIVYNQVEQAGMTVLLSTAYLDEAERCAEVILLHEGKVINHAPPKHFSEPLQGRTWLFESDQLTPRQLQLKLSLLSGVIDALIANQGVRVVSESTEIESILTAVDPAIKLQIKAVQPIFEDAFISLLKKRDDHSVNYSGSHQLSKSVSSAEEVIKVEKLERRFGDFIAVNDVSFSVKRGEIFGLLGANGAGKSTTFRMLCGLLPLSSGQLSVAGVDLRHASDKARQKIGYMAQKFSLYGNLTVIQNLHFYASCYGLFKKRKQEQVEWALEAFELSDYRDSNAKDLPLGYKQRLSFAVALMHEPEILFLDEPTSGVDPLARREFWARTNALAESGVTVLVTTHFMDEANYCDRLIIMASGQVLAQGTPLQLKQLAQKEAQPLPTMEEAFIYLIEQQTDQSA